MTNAIATMMTSLTAILADLDVAVLAKSQVWAARKASAVREFKANCDRRKMGEHQYYAQLFALAGGKQWANILSGSDKSISEFIVKNCAATAEKRNLKIAKQLDKAGVTEINNSEYAYSEGGFNGVFRVNTDNGLKVVTIDTITAGGYAIQCFHLRVLVKVK